MPRQAVNHTLRRRIELGIRVAAPLLDLFLGTAERLSRVLEGDRHPATMVIAPQAQRPAARAIRMPDPPLGGQD
jgi:hypothetical protein